MNSMFQSSSHVTIHGGTFINQHLGSETKIVYRSHESLTNNLEVLQDNQRQGHPALEGNSPYESNVYHQPAFQFNKPNNVVYSNLLSPKYRGHPLWIPQPSVHTPAAYRARGVHIGDVGLITARGGFEFLFNICLPSDDPINSGRAPTGFKPLSPPLQQMNTHESKAFSSGSYLVSSSITSARTEDKNCEMVFESNSPEGSILLMPDDTYQYDLNSPDTFIDHISLQAEGWYKFINGPCGRRAQNGDLCLVTGCDKTTSWGMAAFSNSNQSPSRFRFRATGHMESPYTWEHTGIADVRVGPGREECQELCNQSKLCPLRNQCLFVRSLKIRLPASVWKGIGQAVTLPSRDVSSHDSTPNLLVAVPEPEYLSNVLADYLLRKAPNAKVAVTRDQEISSLMALAAISRDTSDLISKMLCYNDICVSASGVAHLRQKNMPQIPTAPRIGSEWRGDGPISDLEHGSPPGISPKSWSERLVAVRRKVMKPKLPYEPEIMETTLPGQPRPINQDLMLERQTITRRVTLTATECIEICSTPASYTPLGNQRAGTLPDAMKSKRLDMMSPMDSCETLAPLSTRVRHVEDDGLYSDLPSKSDIIIAVMGPTGAGKSTFINKVAGMKETNVGHSLESCTSEIQVVRCYDRQGRRIVLVDTPGFDDTNISDLDILHRIAAWLKETYEHGVTLSGLFYFHRISDNRLAGSSLKLLETFKNLCGAQGLANVILVTTMWDEVEEDVGETRELELCNNFWKSMIASGSKTARFDHSYESGWEIVHRIDPQSRRPVLLQIEMVDEKKSLPETAAGRSLVGWLLDILQSIQKTIAAAKILLRSHKNRKATRLALMETISKNEVKTTTINQLLKEYHYVEIPRSSTPDSEVTVTSSSFSLSRYDSISMYYTPVDESGWQTTRRPSDIVTTPWL